MTKPGYLYVLTQPSDLDLYKIGVTILHPEERLAQHNCNYQEYAGRIVKETGQRWSLKTFIPVADPYWAESAFWSATPFCVMPYRGGIEVEKMEWPLVLAGLEAARSAGIRRPPSPRTIPIKNGDWMAKQLEGTGIVMLGRYSGLVRGMEFRCEKGHVFKDSPGLVATLKSCPCCVDWGWLRGPRSGLRLSLR